MKQVNKSVLLWYSAREMFDLVTAVPQYPQFLPWCERTEILEQDEAGMSARLHLAYMGVRHSFTTRNTHDLGRRVDIRLLDGPFSLLEGTWQFNSLGNKDDACKVEFDLRYEFSSAAFSALVSPVFDRIANTFIESFVARAQAVYGPR